MKVTKRICQLCRRPVDEDRLIACSGHVYECVDPCTPARKKAFEDETAAMIERARDKEYSSGEGDADAQLAEFGVTKRALLRVRHLRRGGIAHFRTREPDHTGVHYHYCFKAGEGGSQWLRFPLRQ